MKYTLTFLAAIILQSCSSNLPQQQAAPPAPTEVVTITTGSALTENDYTASLEGKTDVEIRPQVEGRLAQVLVDEGSFVQAGQGLFKIDDLPYREQYNSAVAGLHAAEAAITGTQVEIDKVTPLVQNKVVSDVQLKTARAAHQLAVANARTGESRGCNGADKPRLYAGKSTRERLHWPAAEKAGQPGEPGRCRAANNTYGRGRSVCFTSRSAKEISFTSKKNTRALR